MAGDKQHGAMLTIGELSAALGLPTHILRYWETKFRQLTPLKRSGNRRYYRPEDVALAKAIDALLNTRGFTIKGAQRELRKDSAGAATEPLDETVARSERAAAPDSSALRAIRDRLARALAAA